MGVTTTGDTADVVGAMGALGADCSTDATGLLANSVVGCRIPLAAVDDCVALNPTVTEAPGASAAPQSIPVSV